MEESSQSRVFLFIGGGFLILALAALLFGGDLRRHALESVPESAVAEPTETAVSTNSAQEVQDNLQAPLPTPTLIALEALALQGSRGISNLYIEFIFDAAGSILDGYVDQVLDRNAAANLLSENLHSYAAETNIGLRMFKPRPGAQANEQAGCRDTDLIAPLRAGQIELMTNSLADIQDQGPLALQPALLEALMDFDHGNQQRENHIVLISSGQADCWDDPCRLVEFMAGRGLNLTFHVVGVGADGTAREQLSCIAEKSGGFYYDVWNDEELAAALDQIQAQVLAAENITAFAAATATAQAISDNGVATRVNRLAEAISAFTTPANTAVTLTLTATPTLTPEWTVTPTTTATTTTTATLTAEPEEITSTPTPQQVIAQPTPAGGSSLVIVTTENPGCSGMGCGGGAGSGGSGSTGGGSGPGADPGFPGSGE